MDEKKGLIVTLLVEEGNTPGQPIGSYSPGRKTHHLVFLPGKAPVGKQVRVKLVETGKTDKRGAILYRGVPAPVEDVFRYKDNGDGSFTTILIARDWLGEEVVAAEEQRLFATRESVPDTFNEYSVSWGGNLGSSTVVIAETSHFYEEKEYVASGSLAWRRTGNQRKVVNSTTPYPIIETVAGGSEWSDKRLGLVYGDSTKTNVRASYLLPSGETSNEFADTWGQLPLWWRAEQEALRPICGCGRQRREQQTDGYRKCETCRAEEHCARCGKQARVAVIGGRLVCTACEHYEETEQLIASCLSANERTRIAAEAKKLFNGQAFVGAEGETVLRVTAEHIPEGRQRDSLVQRWNGYDWYYLCNDGVYGTKLAPAALQILQFLPLASGNGLVEMVAWLCGGRRTASIGKVYIQGRDIPDDFYLQSQMEGLGGILKPAQIRNEIEHLKIADMLRGSEADRLAAVSGYQRLVVKLGNDADEVKTVAIILQAEAQNYAAALAEIRKADEFLAVCETGSVLREFQAWHRRGGAASGGDGWVIRPDGSLREADGGERVGGAGNAWLTWKTVTPDELALVWRQQQIGDDYEVVKLPVKGCTPSQFSAVARIEEEIGAQPCTFLVSEPLKQQAQATIQAVRQLLERVVGKAAIQQLTWNSLVGRSGVLIDRLQMPVITAFRVAGGMLELEPVDSYGFHGIGARWRPVTSEEDRGLKQVSEPRPEVIPPQQETFQPVTTVPAPIQATGGTVFIEIGNRSFRCACGATERLTKTDWRDYQAGQEIPITCPGCRAEGWVKK